MERDVCYWPILLKNSPATLETRFWGVLDPLATSRSCLLRRSETCISAASFVSSLTLEFFNRIDRKQTSIFAVQRAATNRNDNLLIAARWVTLKICAAVRHIV